MASFLRDTHPLTQWGATDPLPYRDQGLWFVGQIDDRFHLEIEMIGNGDGLLRAFDHDAGDVFIDKTIVALEDSEETYYQSARDMINSTRGGPISIRGGTHASILYGPMKIGSYFIEVHATPTDPAVLIVFHGNKEFHRQSVDPAQAPPKPVIPEDYTEEEVVSLFNAKEVSEYMLGGPWVKTALKVIKDRQSLEKVYARQSTIRLAQRAMTGESLSAKEMEFLKECQPWYHFFPEEGYLVEARLPEGGPYQLLVCGLKTKEAMSTHTLEPGELLNWEHVAQQAIQQLQESKS